MLLNLLLTKMMHNKLRRNIFDIYNITLVIRYVTKYTLLQKSPEIKRYITFFHFQFIPFY